MRQTTRTQIAAYRFFRRRARHAVVARDVRMLQDPDRNRVRAVFGGGVLAALIVAGAVILSLLSPAGDVDREPLMIGSDSGAMYVRLSDRVHPVLNLASARLLLGSPEDPVRVRDDDLAGSDRGPTVGIPGAPTVLPDGPEPPTERSIEWTVCDESGGEDPARAGLAQTTLTASEGGQPQNGAAAGDDGRGPWEEAAGPGTERVAFVEYSGRRWLLRDGVRARVDSEAASLLEPLGLGGHEPRPASPALLNMLVEVAPLDAPEIRGVGDPVDYADGAVRVGRILVSDTADGFASYVALPDGVQQVSGPVANLVRATYAVGETVRVSPDLLAAFPRSEALDVSAYPAASPMIQDVDTSPVVCARWDSGSSPRRGTGPRLGFAETPPESAVAPVDMPGADGPGPRIDRIGIPGRGLVVTATGGTPDLPARGSSHVLLSDTGVRFDLADAEASEALGLSTDPVEVPAGVLERLPSGPVLGTSEAATVHEAPDVEVGEDD